MSPLLPLLHSLGLTLFNSMLSFVWQSSLLLGGFLAVDMLLLRKYSATFRYQILFIVLLLIVVLPVTNRFLTVLETPVDGIPLLPSVEPHEYFEPVPNENSPAFYQSSASTSLLDDVKNNPGLLFLIGISLGWLLFTVRLIGGILEIHSWKKSARAISDHFAVNVLHSASSQVGYLHLIRFVQSDRVVTPVATGVRHATVLLPQNQWREYSSRDLEVIAMHETAHLKHYDPIKLFILELFRCTLFFHPLVWILIHHLRSLGEASADEEVLQSGTEPAMYAHLLVGLMEQHKQRRQHMKLAAALFYRKKRFHNRIASILTHNRLHSPSRKLLSAITIAVVLVFSLALSMPLSQVSMAEDTDLVQSEAPCRFPCDSHHISWAFGMREDPFNHRERLHEGVDFFGDTGDPVYASAAGTVAKAEFHEAYGNHIWLQHANGYTTLYSHMDELLVSAGDEVTEGQTIGKIGTTGRSTGPHLHFGIYLDEEPVDPLTVLTTPPYIVLDDRTDPQAHDQIRQVAETNHLRLVTDGSAPTD